jgi:hypothetical protein
MMFHDVVSFYSVDEDPRVSAYGFNVSEKPRHRGLHRVLREFLAAHADEWEEEIAFTNSNGYLILRRTSLVVPLPSTVSASPAPKGRDAMVAYLEGGVPVDDSSAATAFLRRFKSMCKRVRKLVHRTVGQLLYCRKQAPPLLNAALYNAAWVGCPLCPINMLLRAAALTHAEGSVLCLGCGVHHSTRVALTAFDDLAMKKFPVVSFDDIGGDVSAQFFSRLCEFHRKDAVVFISAVWATDSATKLMEHFSRDRLMCVWRFYVFSTSVVQIGEHWWSLLASTHRQRMLITAAAGVSMWQRNGTDEWNFLGSRPRVAIHPNEHVP